MPGKVPGKRAKGESGKGRQRTGRKTEGRYRISSRTRVKMVRVPCPNTGRGRGTCGVCGGADGTHGTIEVVDE